jgi:hypothetical protein
VAVAVLAGEASMAGLMFGLVGFLTVIFNVILGSLRQALTSDRLLGRVIAVLCLPAVNARTIAAPRAAAGLEPGP